MVAQKQDLLHIGIHLSLISLVVFVIQCFGPHLVLLGPVHLLHIHIHILGFVQVVVGLVVEVVVGSHLPHIHTHILDY